MSSPSSSSPAFAARSAVASNQSSPACSTAVDQKKKAVKVVVKRPKKTKSRPVVAPHRQRPRKQRVPSHFITTALPNTTITTTTTTQQQSLTQQQQQLDEEEQADFSGSSFLEDLPCDTLLAVRSLQRSGRALHIPLCCCSNNNSTTIHGVLECQLQDMLEENLLCEELQRLLHAEKKLKRLTDASASTSSVVVLVETKDYQRAVWDARQAYVVSNQKNDTTNTNTITAEMVNAATTWFVSTVVPHETRRLLDRRVLQQSWEQYQRNNKNNNNEIKHQTATMTWRDAVNILIQMQVLLAQQQGHHEDHYLLWLPNWGQVVLKSLRNAETKVLSKLKRSLHKELPQSQLQQRNDSNAVSSALVLQHLQSQGRVKVVERPAGAFVRLVQ